MLFLGTSQTDDFFDHARMCDDLLATWDHFSNGKHVRGRISPPMAVLSRLGDDLLHATSEDSGAWSIRHNWRLLSVLKARTFGFTCQGTLPVNYAMAAAILGRRDLHSRHFSESWFDLDSAITWFVLHGIVEHKLWHYLTDEFLAALVKKVVPIGRGIRISPLEFLLLRERPDFAIGLPSSARPADVDFRLREWMKSDAIPTYRLSWVPTLIPAEALAQRLAGAAALAPDTLPAEVAGLVFQTARSSSSGRIYAETLLRRRLETLSPSLAAPVRLGYGAPARLCDLLLYGMFRDLIDGSVLIDDTAVCFVIPPQLATRKTVVLESRVQSGLGAIVSFVATLQQVAWLAPATALDDQSSVIPMRLLPLGPGGGRILLLIFSDLLPGAAAIRMSWLIHNIWIL